MPTLKQQIQNKVDSLEVGVVTHLYNIVVTNTGDGISARSIWNDPRIYKPIFSLDKLGIDKSLKSVVLEIKDSVARMYYILDSSCFFIDFDCDYQILELVKELPIEVVQYLRILCSKKGRLELIVREDSLFILFEDTFPSKMPMKERKEKEVDKYVLSTSLNEVSELDKEVIEFSYNLVFSLGYKTTPIGQDIPNLPINLSTINCPYKKEPIEYWGTINYTDSGEFTVVDTLGLPISLVICPTLVSKDFEVSSICEENTKLLTLDDEIDDNPESIDYKEIYE